MINTMKQFEYKVHNIVVPYKSNLVKELCIEGNDGWEVVHIEKINKCMFECIFKREITEEVRARRMKKKSEFLDKPLREFRDWLSVRSLNVLKYADIDTPRQLIDTRRSTLLGFRNFGKKSLRELDEFLDHFGFAFGQDLSEYEEVSHD